MIASVKYQNEWFHDGRKHENISKGLRMMLTGSDKKMHR